MKKGSVDVVTISAEHIQQQLAEVERNSEEFMFKIALNMISNGKSPTKEEFDKIFAVGTPTEDKESFLWLASTRLEKEDLLKLATCMIFSTRSIIVEEAFDWVPSLRTILRCIVMMKQKSTIRAEYIAKLATKMISKMNHVIQTGKMQNSADNMSINMMNMKRSYLSMVVESANESATISEGCLHFDALCVEFILSLEKYNSIICTYGIPHMQIDTILDNLIVLATEPAELNSKYIEIVNELMAHDV